jgi:hypothetical protein
MVQVAMHVRVSHGAGAHQLQLESAARRSFEQEPQELPVEIAGSSAQTTVDAASSPPPPSLPDSAAASASARQGGVPGAMDACPQYWKSTEPALTAVGEASQSCIAVRMP